MLSTGVAEKKEKKKKQLPEGLLSKLRAFRIVFRSAKDRGRRQITAV